MLILAADTSGKNGSIALVRFHGENAYTLDVVPLEGGTFSAQLVPQIADVLAKQNLQKSDIDAFAVVSGPGSFTGLRVGLAVIKALAEILRKPIAAVSSLEALARSPKLDIKSGDQVIAALDAGRGEIYSGTFSCSDNQALAVDQKLVALDEFEINAAGQQVVTSDSKLFERLSEAKLRVALVPRPSADAIARLGFEKTKAGEIVTPETLDASYIRRTDAEVKFGN
ncbi:MAG TPA: tRNA (adenosine(37)-N6)-threonylcarbamoyltransferase complex dimerization subunit type 1 TsaB [Terriglobales bacterium]|jgi:tRNA threonylcarbamoyladenosine biosynthesis protein TsaB